GMVLAPFFLRDKVLAQRMRVMAFTLLTPFYFLKAGSLVKAETLATGIGIIAVYLAVKMATKFVGVRPLTKIFRFEPKEGMYTTLMMSTGLTFGSISALFGFTNGIINQDQYTILVAAVIGSAVVPTLIAQKWFQPRVDTRRRDFSARRQSAVQTASESEDEVGSKGRGVN
ncbi:MAG: cation:proton antiporter, partial [Desulfomonilaceae bacterium]|nr:cation:proton antiporter [Desulfomonilaceae bacterium]